MSASTPSGDSESAQNAPGRDEGVEPVEPSTARGSTGDTPAGKQAPLREVPDIPEGATQDLPPGSAEGDSSWRNSHHATEKVDRVHDPDGDHRRGMDKEKLKFARYLIFICVGAVIVLSLIQFFFQHLFSEISSLSPAIDMAKLLATTALGFVFGRTLNSRE